MKTCFVCKKEFSSPPKISWLVNDFYCSDECLRRQENSALGGITMLLLVLLGIFIFGIYFSVCF